MTNNLQQEFVDFNICTTQLGKQQQYALGKWLRRRYKNFLSNTFNVNDTYVQSSDVDRTLMSAQCNLAGLYPPEDEQIWNEDLLWQPIPVHSMPVTTDRLIAGGVTSSCPAYQNAYNAYLASSELTRFGESIQPVCDYLTKNIGQVIASNDYQSILLIRDAWLCESVHNLT